MGCSLQAAWPERLLSEKSDAVALQQIKERGALPMIDRNVVISGVVRHRPLQQYLGFTAGRWLWSVWSIRLTARLQNLEEAGGTVERLMLSRVTAIISALVICIIVCLSWAVNHYRDNAITYKAQRDKMPEN